MPSYPAGTCAACGDKQGAACTGCKKGTGYVYWQQGAAQERLKNAGGCHARYYHAGRLPCSRALESAPQWDCPCLAPEHSY